MIPVVGRFLDRRNIDRHAKRPLLKLARFGVVFVAISVAFGFADYGNFLFGIGYDDIDEEGIDIPYPNRTLEGGLELTNTEGIVQAAGDN